MNPLVLYHSNCMDGFCAAWVVHKVYPDAEYCAVSYSDPPPDVTNRHVIIVDFSYKQAILEEMRSKALSLQVLDHHKTAQEDLRDLSYCQFDMNKSGARLAWDSMVCSSYVPNIVLYIEDRDLWKFELPYSKEVNAALASYPKDFTVWDQLAEREISELILEGTAILRYQNQLIDTITAQAESIEFDGHIVPMVNSPLLQSEIGNKLAQKQPFAIVWYEVNGQKRFSLRSTNSGVDVSEIAKQHGGGGHRNASGFNENLK